MFIFVGIFSHFRRGWCLHQHLGLFRCIFIFTSSSWPFSYSNLATMFDMWFNWVGFIHIASLWWQPFYLTQFSSFLRHVCFMWSIPLISITNLCSTASTSSRTFCFWFRLCSSCKNNFNFWNVKGWMCHKISEQL